MSLITFSYHLFCCYGIQTVFPLPSLRTVEGLEVCYMRPSRHCVKTTDTRVVLDILGYTLSTMMEREEPCSKGVVLLANMEGFAMCNYATDYWYQLMSMLQGQKVPVRIARFLIVNPPKWFKNIWNLTEPMLTPDFVARSEMIVNESDLSKYLAAGYEMHLPDEMETGHALTEKLVDDFVDYRKAVESVQGHQLAFQRRQSMTVTRQPSQSSSLSHKNKPRDAAQSSIVAAFDANIAESSSLEELQGSRSGIWNTAFARSSRRLIFSDDKEEKEEEGIHKQQLGMRKQGMQQRAASCRILFAGKVKRSNSESFSRSLLGMMQRQPSSDNLSCCSGRNGETEFTRPQLRRRDQPSSSRSLLTGSIDQEVGKSPPNSPRRSHERNMLGSSKSEEEDLSKSPIMKSPETPRKRLQMSPRQQSHNSLLRCGEKTPPHHHHRPKMSTSHDGKMSCEDKFSAEDQPANYLAKSPHRSRMSMIRQQSHNGLLCEKQSAEDHQTRVKSSNLSSRRFGLLRQLSQDIRLPYEKSEETLKRRGGRRGDDWVKQQQSSERMVAGGRPKTPMQRSSSTRRELPKAKSFKSLVLSSSGKSTSSPAGGRSKMPRQ